MKIERRSSYRRIPHALRLWSVSILVVGILVTAVSAHDPGLSAARLQVADNGASLWLSYARADIERLVRMDGNRDGKVSGDEIDAARLDLIALFAGAVRLEIDTAPVLPESTSVSVDANDNVTFDSTWSFKGASRIGFQNDMIGRLPAGHRQYFTLVDEQGRTLYERLMDAGGNRIDTEAKTGNTEKPRSFAQFFTLGIEHIVTGFDHLAFLFALLLVGGTIRQSAAIITSFTLAHSITLALATFELVHLPTSLVEPLIAASIVYVGLENIIRREVKRRWLLTFAFGLVHGLGFATVLREFGIGGSVAEAFVPLFSFNLGVEVGQLAIAAAVLPLIWKLKQRHSFVPRFVPFCSALLVLVGGYWLVERILF